MSSAESLSLSPHRANIPPMKRCPLTFTVARNRCSHRVNTQYPNTCHCSTTTGYIAKYAYSSGGRVAQPVAIKPTSIIWTVHTASAMHALTCPVKWFLSINLKGCNCLLKIL